MLNKKAFQSQSGQVAVVVFLIMAVMLVVGLSLAARTSQEIELAGQQEDTTRVFNAAETGIEEALSEESNFTGVTVAPKPISALPANTTGTYSVTPDDTFENTFQSGETATVYTNKNAAAKNVDISWAKTEANCSSVLVVSVYTEPTANNFEAQHYGVRPRGCGGFTSTNFPESSNLTPASGYKYIYRLTAPANTVMVRIKPLYAATTITVSSDILSEQMYTIRSEAQDTSVGNTEVRAIQVTRSKPAPPAILDYALYSGNTLTKN